MRALWTHSWLAFCWHEAAAQKYEYRERKCMLWNDADFITILVPIQRSQVLQNEQRLFMVPKVSAREAPVPPGCPGLCSPVVQTSTG